MRHSVLVSGNSELAEGVYTQLVNGGYRPHTVSNGQSVIASVRRLRPNLVFVADGASSGGWEPELTEIRAVQADLPVIVVTARLTPDLVFNAASLGATDCIGYPPEPGLLEDTVARLGRPGTPSSRCRLRRARQVRPGVDEMVVGRSAGMVDVLKVAGSVAESSVKVLIQGETGTGKELIASAIHRASGREGPFVAVNCAAIVETLAESELFGHERGAFTGAVARRAGCFEQAAGGTLFLDEVGEATPAFQAKLLRVLDRGEFRRVGGRDLLTADARILTATNRDLETMAAEGAFREDLYYRLSEITLVVPPLRERKTDLPEMVARLLEACNAERAGTVRGVSDEALEQLLAHPWPGNVRELQNVLNRAAVLCRRGVILPWHLEGIQRSSPPPRVRAVETLNDVEREHISRVLDITGWNRGRACELLGITRPTLRRKMKNYGLANA